MMCQQFPGTGHGLQHALPPFAVAEACLHRTADGVPLGLRHARRNAAVGQYLDAAIDQLQADRPLPVAAFISRRDVQPVAARAAALGKV